MPIILNSGNVLADPSLADLVEEVLAQLTAWVRNQEQATWLTSVLTEDGLTIQVDDAQVLTKGVCEINYEQVYLSSVSPTSMVATVAAFGRGYNATVREQHEVGEKVVASPLFPRIRIAEAVNQTIASLRGKLPVVTHTDFTYQVGQTTYTLPDDCVEVLGVEQRSYGSTGMWEPILAWRHNTHTASGSDTGSNSIDLLCQQYADNTVRVTYGKYPQFFSSTDDLYSVTGLEMTARDVLTLGAAARMLTFVDAGRLNIDSAAADVQDSNVQIGSAQSLSRYLYQLHLTRVDEERARILGQHNQYVNFPGV